MAGGIDWFRWHHGSVADPKFGLVAKRANARLGDVIALWAFVLESASECEERGAVGQLDMEAIDFMLGMDDGTAARILGAMTARGLLGAGGRIASWEKRQPKREREDDTAAERKRRQRERDAAASGHGTPSEANGSNVTPRHATSHQKTPRGEESREEGSEANASAGKPADDLTKDELWTEGKSLLQQGGMPKSQCGSFVGKLVKDFGNEIVIDAVRAAVVARPADPAGYLTAACQHSAGQRVKPPPAASFAERDRIAGMQRWEEMTGREHPDLEPLRRQGSIPHRIAAELPPLETLTYESVHQSH